MQLRLILVGLPYQGDPQDTKNAIGRFWQSQGQWFVTGSQLTALQMIRIYGVHPMSQHKCTFAYVA